MVAGVSGGFATGQQRQCFFLWGKMDGLFFWGGNLFFLGTFRNCFGEIVFFWEIKSCFFSFFRRSLGLCCKEDILDMTQLLVS